MNKQIAAEIVTFAGSSQDPQGEPERRRDLTLSTAEL
jgi:hypothetical protein